VLIAHVCVKQAMPGTFRLHVPTFHHTYLYTYVRDNASFPGILTLRRSLSGETLDPEGRRSTPIDFFVRGLTNGLFALFWIF
jgi:hypothetical protein